MLMMIGWGSCGASSLILMTIAERECTIGVRQSVCTSTLPQSSLAMCGNVCSHCLFSCHSLIAHGCRGQCCIQYHDGKYDAWSNVLAREYCQCGALECGALLGIHCHQPPRSNSLAPILPEAGSVLHSPSMDQIIQNVGFYNPPITISPQPLARLKRPIMLNWKC